MPFIKQSTISDNDITTARQAVAKAANVPEEQVSDEVTFTEGFGLGWKDINTIGNATSLVSDLLQEPNAPEDDFDLKNYLSGYEEHAERFAFVRSSKDALALQQKIDSERKVDERLSEAGWAGWLGYMSSALLDPINLVPGGSAVKAVRYGSRVGLTAARTGRNFAIAEAGAEVLRQSAQETRTAEESAAIVASVGVLGGVMGGAISALSKQSRALLQAEVAETLGGKALEIDITKGIAKGSFSHPGSAGAMEAAQEGFELDKLGTLGLKITQPGLLKGPMARGVLSESPTLRSMTHQMFENQLITKRVREGEGVQAVDSIQKNDAVKTMNSLRKVKELFLDVTGVKPGTPFASSRAAISGRLGQDMPFRTISEFSEAVGRRLISDSDHAIPQVNKAAEVLREEIFTSWGKKMQEAGILDEAVDVSSASRYFTTVFKREAIVARRQEFEKKLLDSVRRNNTQTKVLAKSMLEQLKAVESKTLADEARIARLEKIAARKSTTNEDLEIIVGEMTDNMIGLGDNALRMSELSGFLAKGGSKFRKERVLNPDIYKDLDEFIDHDVFAISGSYAQQASSMVRLQEMIQKNGYQNIQDILKDIRQDYDKLASAAKTEKERLKIQKQAEKAIQDFSDNVLITLGRYGKTTRLDSSLDALKQYNVLNKLGSVALASIPDAMNHIIQQGPLKTLFDGLVPMFRNIKAVKAQNDELLDFVLANELEMSDTLKAQLNPDFKFGHKQSKFQKNLDVLTTSFGKLTGMARWNFHNKRLAARVSEAHIVRLIKREAAGKGLSDKDKIFVGESGLNSSMRRRIYDQLYGTKPGQGWGQDVSGSHIANWQKWTDQDAALAMQAAIRKRVDATVVTPGAGDLPKWAQGSKVGQLIFQFKPFTSGIANKIIVPSLQKHDAQRLSGIMGLIGMGSLVYMLRQGVVAGKDIDLSTGNLIREGIQRSGVAGLMGDAAFVIGGNTGLIEDAYIGKYGDRSTSSLIFGPSAFLAEDLVRTTGALVREGIDEKTLGRLGKFLPYQNLFYIRMLMNKLKGKETKRRGR